jgi:hypothetical protein
VLKSIFFDLMHMQNRRVDFSDAVALYVTLVFVSIFLLVCFSMSDLKLCEYKNSDTCISFSDRPTEVQLGIYINSFYSISEQTMVIIYLFVLVIRVRKHNKNP